LTPAPFETIETDLQGVEAGENVGERVLAGGLDKHLIKLREPLVEVADVFDQIEHGVGGAGELHDIGCVADAHDATRLLTTTRRRRDRCEDLYPRQTPFDGADGWVAP
jgi:hypothetical protein